MLNLFKPPFETTTLEAWSKMCDDIAKIAILAIPVMLYGSYTLSFKILNLLILISIGYGFLTLGRFLRQVIIRITKEE
ncbi:hypothetical protein P375_05905 [Gallibacterium genomosp. 2]|uniref:Uncharacterized protein n=2 Tax=Gallibacterium TaxID=155493 RepID=A0A0A2XJF5_9PAST|nr:MULTISPECIES: hypothetical protein [Gallibacterium]KGQ32328.1 hypothetical protein P375_05905 [Gallibacterium genomosp. 2]MDK9560770.1 hypothetical protein [Gallibacterium anatis]WIM80184.1 hypothetical protein QP018_02825 [Gallibacterium anatis]